MSWWNLLLVPCASVIAFGKGRSAIVWGAITIFAGLWSTILVALLPAREIRIPQLAKKMLLNRWIHNEMKGINSPADL